MIGQEVAVRPNNDACPIPEDQGNLDGDGLAGREAQIARRYSVCCDRKADILSVLLVYRVDRIK